VLEDYINFWNLSRNGFGHERAIIMYRGRQTLSILGERIFYLGFFNWIFIPIYKKSKGNLTSGKLLKLFNN
jgi:hypothetical protein